MFAYLYTHLHIHDRGASLGSMLADIALVFGLAVGEKPGVVGGGTAALLHLAVVLDMAGWLQL